MSAASPRKRTRPTSRLERKRRRQFCAVVDVEGGDLPGELQADEGEREEEDQVRAGKEAGDGPEHDGDGIEGADPGRAVVAEAQRGRFQAEHQVVFGVLVGVDRVVADGPGDGAEVERERGPDRATPSSAAQPTSAPQLKARPSTSCGQ